MTTASATITTDTRDSSVQQFQKIGHILTMLGAARWCSAPSLTAPLADWQRRLEASAASLSHRARPDVAYEQTARRRLAAEVLATAAVSGTYCRDKGYSNAEVSAEVCQELYPCDAQKILV